MARIEIDTESGFCFGVVTAIRKAEEELAATGRLYCLGDIVHNSVEVERLRSLGLVTITHEELKHLHDVKVLLRAHGEPPSTYDIARRNNIEIIDATCPVVLALQRRILNTFSNDQQPQIVIYGHAGHAEVNGLVGQTDGRAVVVDDATGLDGIDPQRPVALYSQTTQSLDGYGRMAQRIKQHLNKGVAFASYDTICRQVAHRVDGLKDFARSHDVVIFVSGQKSSNGRFLYTECHNVNQRTYLVSAPSEIELSMVHEADTIGICGATSTPRYLMEQVRDRVNQILSSHDA